LNINPSFILYVNEEKEDIIEKSESSDITTIKNSFVDEGLHSTTSPKQCEKWARNESLETMDNEKTRKGSHAPELCAVKRREDSDRRSFSPDSSYKKSYRHSHSPDLRLSGDWT
jgi:hypothetical protein